MSNYLEPGAWGILATPFQNTSDDLSETDLEKLTNLYIEAGVKGVVASGVFGEGSNLSREEKQIVVEVVSEVAADVPVVVGLSELSTQACIEEAENALSASDKIHSFMVMVNSTRSEQAATHFNSISRATNKPVLIQDYPAVTGISMSYTELNKTIANTTDISGVKSEVPPSALAVQSIVSTSDVPVFGGLGGRNALDELANGAAGIMTGFSFPEAIVKVMETFNEAGFDEAVEVYSKWLPIVNFEGQPGYALAIRKEMFRARGIIMENAVRPPATPFPDELNSLVEQYVALADRLLGD